MSQPTSFLLSDVRCFGGDHWANLKPITLLVGENSTGKSTFLGCYSVLHQMLSRSLVPGDSANFNKEPFSMGSFRNIVRSRRGRDGSIDEFSLGFRLAPVRKSGMRPFRLRITFAEEGSEPTVTSVHYRFDSESFVDVGRSRSGGSVLRVPGSEAELDIGIGDWVFIMDFLFQPDLAKYFGKSNAVLSIAAYLSRFFSLPRSDRRAWLPTLHDLVPIAPLRSKPKRTYDPVRETAMPDGEHIPMLMMRLDRTDKSGWNLLHDDLVDFGQESGLFSDIKVRRHGKQMSDPFQLQVKVRSGSYANLVDVGYGVSQSLPILVDVRSERRSVFLLQQPEVHLHPRAQAGLAELFVESFRKNRNRFLIETHSDYIIDRIRILVRKQTIRPADVSVLYFEPVGNSVKIHNIGMDRDGNLTGTPVGYRDFFVRETDRLLGFE
ncbi:MAG: ATP-binding protein [Spirochaetaceae bacterium]|nr:ATP-binding protein [Spirochaetaceae bacterium]